MDHQKLINKALEIATDAHKGQTRWDGSPYINHPLAVCENAKELLRQFRFDHLDKDIQTAIEIIAILHDVFEDSNKYQLTLDNIRRWFNDIDEAFVDDHSLRLTDSIYEALLALTKTAEEEYWQFIDRIVKGPWMAQAVKIADLRHNLSDLKPGPRKDKYKLAEILLIYTLRRR